MWYTADELSVQKAACRMTDWTPASSCNSQQQQQHGVQSTPADNLWMLNVRHCPYLYVKDGCRGDDGGRRSRHLARFPRYDVTATAAAAYEPPFVDCSSLFANHHQHTVKSECFGSTFWVGTQLPPVFGRRNTQD